MSLLIKILEFVEMMKKVICIFASAFLLSSGAAFAQGEMDAYKFSQYDLNGTARYMSMGGAFGALGGDISAMSTNPAGLGIYRSSEVVTTLSLSSIKAKTDWLGTEMNESRTKFNFDNIAYVGYFPTGNDEGLVSWNVGFSYNRVKNFNRSYRMGRGKGGFSISDYITTLTNGSGVTGDQLQISKTNDPFQNYNWLSVLGYETYMINTPTPSKGGGFSSQFGDGQGPWDVQLADMYVTEKGGIDKYDFSLATNLSNRVFLGATFSVTDLNYRMSSAYDEDFGVDNNNPNQVNSDHLYLDNYSSVDGTGYSLNVGVIVRPTDFLRLGVAYNSPTWYKLTNFYGAEMGTYITDYFVKHPDGDKKDGNLDAKAFTPDDVYTDFKLRSPDRWIFSAAAIIGQTALISVDYELTNYKSMRLYNWSGDPITEDNGYIKEDFGSSGMLKAGAEIKVTPQFSFRFGGAWQNSPMKDHLKNGLIEVPSLGTRTAYTVDFNTSYYTVGLGYRFTPNFYVDAACVYRTQKQDVYPFSRVFDKNGDIIVGSDPASLKTNTTKMALTLGYKF